MTNCLKISKNEKKIKNEALDPLRKEGKVSKSMEYLFYIFLNKILTSYLEDFWKVRLTINMPNLQINSNNFCKSDL